MKHMKIKSIYNFYEKIKAGKSWLWAVFKEKRIKEIILISFVLLLIEVAVIFIHFGLKVNFEFILLILLWLYIDIIALFFIISIVAIWKTLSNLWKTNPRLTIVGIIIITYIFYIFLTPISKSITFSTIRTILMSLATIGALFVGFIPQGIININEQYKPVDDWGVLYDKKELLKELKEIIHHLIIFVGAYIFDILFGLIFPNADNVYDYTNKYILHHNKSLWGFAIEIYLFALIIGLASFIYGFTRIYSITSYFYSFNVNFKILKSKYPKLNTEDLIWLIRNKLDYHSKKKNDTILSIDKLKREFQAEKETHPNLSVSCILRIIKKSGNVEDIFS